MLHTKKYKKYKHKHSTKKYNNKIKYKKGGGSQLLLKSQNNFNDILKKDKLNVENNLNNKNIYISIHNTFISNLENNTLIDILQNFLLKLNNGTVIMFEVDKVIYFNKNPDCNLLRHIPTNKEKLIHFTEIVTKIFNNVKNNIIVIFIFDIKIRLNKNDLCDYFYIDIIKGLKYKYPNITFLYRLNKNKCKPLYIAIPQLHNFGQYSNNTTITSIKNKTITNNILEFDPDEDENENENENEDDYIDSKINDILINKCINTIKLNSNRSPTRSTNLNKLYSQSIDNQLLRTYKGNFFYNDLFVNSNFPSYDIYNNKDNDSNTFYLYITFYLIKDNIFGNIPFENIYNINHQNMNNVSITLTIDTKIFNYKFSQFYLNIIQKETYIDNKKTLIFDIPSKYIFNFILFIFIKDEDFIAYKYNFITNQLFKHFNHNSKNIDNFLQVSTKITYKNTFIKV